MDIGKIKSWLYRYRYPLIVALVGVVLLLLPSRSTATETPSAQVQTSTEEAQTDMAALLAEILGQIDGVGKVQVLLSISVGETTIYQSDEDSTVSDGTSTLRKETVIITDSSKNQQALVSQIIPEQYLGAIVVCEGADNASVKWAVVEAVSKATGLGANQISVLKMK